jgi:hypothetical protein
LGASSMGYVVGNVARGISGGIGWRVFGSVGSGVDQLYYFIFTSSLFSHGLEGTFATTSLARMF